MLLSFHMTSPNGFISEPRLYLLLVCISLTLMFVSMNKRLLYIFSLRVNPSSGLIWYAVFWVFLLLPSKHIAECHILFIFWDQKLFALLCSVFFLLLPIIIFVWNSEQSNWYEKLKQTFYLLHLLILFDTFAS